MSRSGITITPPTPPLAELQELFDARSPFPARLHEPRWSSYFRVNHRQVPSYRRGRVFLAGDAAHIHSPAGGQGMNTGIQDAYNLAWKLGQVCRGIAKEEILDSYHAERHPVGSATVKFATGLQKGLNRRHPVGRAIRDLTTEVVSLSKKGQEMIAKQLCELSYHYRHSPIVSEFRSGVENWYQHANYSDFRDCLDFGSAPQAGDRAVDTTLPEAAGESDDPVRMYNFFQEVGYKLFLFEGSHGDQTARERWPHLRSVAERVLQTYGDSVKPFVVLPRSEAPRYVDYAGPIVYDSTRKLHDDYGARGQCLYLVRPDGYIAYRSDVVNWQRLDGYLNRVLAK